MNPESRRRGVIVFGESAAVTALCRGEQKASDFAHNAVAFNLYLPKSSRIAATSQRRLLLMKPGRCESRGFCCAIVKLVSRIKRWRLKDQVARL